MSQFQLTTALQPCGDQPQAIAQLVQGYQQEDKRFQTLLGVTGSGKTFTMAHVIAALGLPTLVMSHNKTLAAQLYAELRTLFPHNAVEYFVSYYDYYQPEAYIPQRDIYIEKDAAVNEDLDRLRLAATSALLTRQDVIVVASVSCIYNLGDPREYRRLILNLVKGQCQDRDAILARLVTLLYERNDYELLPGRFRVRGDVVEIFPPYDTNVIRVELFGDEIESLSMVAPLSGEFCQSLEQVIIYPARHFIIPPEQIAAAVEQIRAELEQRLAYLRQHKRLVEAQRLEARTLYDIEMLQEIGFCKGIENYSRYLSGRAPGDRPYCLLDYFPAEFLTIVDESHVSLPQIRGMYAGDQARKQTLVEHGFRLPSALDNRPLTFAEWESLLHKVLYVSATPGPYELEKTQGQVVEQIIRPTGLLDPVVSVVPAVGQIAHLTAEIKKRRARGERVLVTTSTKRLAEDIADFFHEQGITGTYLHCELDAFERVQILQDLRKGIYDVVVGINLLREGLDLPEVALVAILDADKEGFLRSETALIQTMGRAARNAAAEVILYAQRMTASMQKAIAETQRRRQIQMAYNRKHGIQPRTIVKEIVPSIAVPCADHEAEQSRVPGQGVREQYCTYVAQRTGDKEAETRSKNAQAPDLQNIAALQAAMLAAAEQLDFEKAALLRDRLLTLQGASASQPSPAGKRTKGKRRRKHY